MCSIVYTITLYTCASGEGGREGGGEGGREGGREGGGRGAKENEEEISQ